MEPVFSATVAAGDRASALSVTEEDVTQVYPGLFRYTVSAAEAGSTVALFRTNTYEYSPGVPLHAKEVALSKAGEWERDIRNDPAGFTGRHAGKPAKPRMTSILQKAGAVIVQASPRADGNSGTIAPWACSRRRSSSLRSSSSTGSSDFFRSWPRRRDLPGALFHSGSGPGPVAQRHYVGDRVVYLRCCGAWNQVRAGQIGTGSDNRQVVLDEHVLLPGGSVALSGTYVH